MPKRNWRKRRAKNQKEWGYTRWKCRTLKIRGDRVPIESLSTPDLIQELNRLKAVPSYFLLDQIRQQIRYLNWVITWRNRDQYQLPKDLRYNPQKWSLEELSPTNHPKNIHELSILYRIAIARGSLGHVNLLHDILITFGFIYKPSYVNDQEVWQHDELIPIGDYLDREDSLKLQNRGLDSPRSHFNKGKDHLK